MPAREGRPHVLAVPRAADQPIPLRTADRAGGNRCAGPGGLVGLPARSGLDVAPAMHRERPDELYYRSLV